MSSTQAGFFDSLVSAVRENPLAAALIGGGAAWLLIGNEKLKNTAASATAAASPIVDIATRHMRTASSRLDHPVAPPTVPDMDQDEPLHTAKRLRDAGSEASDTAKTVKDRVGDSMAHARESIVELAKPLPGKQTFSKLQSSLTDTLERQPLLLGMAGLAIGATVAGAFRTTDLENEWAGELSDDVKADLGTRAKAVSQSLREASDTLQAELGDTGAEALARLKQAGMGAAKAARDTVG